MARNTRVVNTVTNEQPTTGVQHADVVGDDTVQVIGDLNERTSRILVTLEGADARVTYDGQDPDNTGGSEVGHLFFDGAVFDLNRNTANAMKFLEAVAGSHYTLRISEFE